MPTYQTTPTVSTYRPQVGTPTRKTSEHDLDEFNKQLRVSPLYQNFMRSRGLPTNGHAKLSDRQQKELEQAMGRAGFPVPKGMHIDQGGNLNQKSHLVRNTAIVAALAVGTIATLGAAGVIGGGVLGTGLGAGAGSTAAGTAAAGHVANAAGMIGASGVGGGIGGAAGTGLAASVPGVVAGGTAATSVANAAGMIGASGVGGGIGGAASVPVLASSAAPISGAGAFAVPTVAGVGGGGSSIAAPIISNTTRTGMAGLTGSDWVDIGGKGLNAGLQLWGGNQAQNAADRAAEIQAKALSEQTQLEREKELRRQYEWDQAEAAKKRNQAIDEENRLEDLRRLDEREAQGEPTRLAREATYRAYMKKYWNIDVAPSVARTSRNIQAGTAAGAGTAGTAEQTPSSSKQAVDWSPSPLARLAVPGTGYGSFVSGGGVTPQGYSEPLPTIELAEDPRYPTNSAARRARFSDQGSPA